MSRATVELDFFGMEKDNNSSSSSAASSKSQFRNRKLFNRQRSFRDIQSAISKMDPELLKSVITPAQTTPGWKPNSFSVPSSPREELNLFPGNLPVLTPTPRPANEPAPVNASPMTIFYNGTVSVYDVSPENAENIFKLVAESTKHQPCESGERKVAIVQPSNEQRQQLIRRISLQRFLEKRKERLTTGASPYATEPKNAFQ